MTDNQYKIQLHICFSQLYPLNFNPPLKFRSISSQTEMLHIIMFHRNVVNRIRDVMVIVLNSTVLDRSRVKPKSKDWLARNQDNVS